MICYDKTAKESLALLGANAKTGLSEHEVTKRQAKYGLNELTEHEKPSLIMRFLSQFNDFMILILIAASIVSFGLALFEGHGDFADSVIILAIVFLNAFLGLIQEYKAEKSLDALKKMSAPHAKVIRDGVVKSIESVELVPGDIILLEAGDFVPADARLIEAHNLKIQESALTGESEAVLKDAQAVLKSDSALGDLTNMVFSSGIVTYGRAKAVVSATGMYSEVGKIAFLIMDEEKSETPLQMRLKETGKLLGMAALIICAVIFLLGIYKKFEFFEMFMTSVSLAVAAIPEGLPAIVTIMLSIGVLRMSKKNAIIRKLPAVETLGSATVICSDKTGTLTQNRMKVVEMADSDGVITDVYKKEQILLLGSLCNDAYYSESDNQVMGDPTEAAIISAVREYKSLNEYIKRNARVSEIPFDSKRKLMTTIHNDTDGYKVITKGAPDVLVTKCAYYLQNGEVLRMTKEKSAEIEHINTAFGEKALRVIAVAYKFVHKLHDNVTSENTECGLVFAGLIGMIDPPRAEAKDAVGRCKRAGIKPVMVTGDHVITAKAIARKLGILNVNDSAVTGKELEDMSQDELIKNIHKYSVFARVSPEHKMRIVKAFKEKGEIVAMTGDGVNDAPALKASDIGCAMGITGTDVSREAADMVLTDDNFATIVEAVSEGRAIYQNIKKAVHFLLSSNIGEIITIFTGIAMGWPTPLLAIQLLWVNLVTDSLPAIALGVDPPDKNIMRRPPVKAQKNLFGDGLAATIAIEGTMIGMLALLAFGIGIVYFDSGNGVDIGRTMAFATLSISQLFHAFNMRSEESLTKIDIFENKQLVSAFVVGLILQVSVITIEPIAKVFKVVSLTPKCWGIVLLLSFMPIILVEMEKLFDIRKKHKYEKRYLA